MIFCFQSTNDQEKYNTYEITTDNKMQKNVQSFNQFEENQCHQKTHDLSQKCHKVTLPQSNVRSNSLNKDKSVSVSKNQKLIFKQNQNQKPLRQKFGSFNSNSNEGDKIYNNTSKNKGNIEQQNKNLKSKQAIFSKLLQKNHHSQNKNFQGKGINTKFQTQKLKNKQNLNQKSILIPQKSFYHKHQNVQKLVSIFKQKTQKQLKQCTFNPKINCKTQLNQPNSQINKLKAQHFFNYQLQYYKNTQNKIQQIRAMIQAQKQKQNTFKPAISEQTAQLTVRRTQINVYDRLYGQKQDNCGLSSRQISKNRKQNNIMTESNQIKRASSKKSISIVSGRKNKSINLEDQCESKQLENNKILKTGSLKKFTQFQNQFNKQSTSTQIKNRLIKDNLRKQNLSKNIAQNQLKNNQRGFSYQFKRNQIQNMNQSQNNFQTHFVNCRQLIKQKQGSNKNLLQNNSRNGSKLQETSRKKNHTETKNQTPKLSQKSIKLSLQKFIKQLLTVYKLMNLSSSLTYQTSLIFLKNTNFIEDIQQFNYFQQQQQNKSSINKQKFDQIWSLLEGDSKKNILFVNLIKILCAIMGYHKSCMIQNALKTVQQQLHVDLNSDQRSMNSKKLLILNQKDSMSIKNQFSNFYFTKFKLGQSKLLNRNTSNDYNNFSFKPSISKQSQNYAQRYRQRIINQGHALIQQGLIQFNVPQNGIIDHRGLLMLDQKIKQYKKNSIRRQHQRQKKRMEDQSMIQQNSFSRRSRSNNIYTDRSISTNRHHQISTNKNQQYCQNQYQNKQDNSNKSKTFSRISYRQQSEPISRRSQQKIFQQLYEKGLKQRSNRQDRSTEEIQYQQAKNELTFKPKTNKNRIVTPFNDDKNQYSNPSSQINTHQKIPNFTKDIMRMRKTHDINNKKASSLKSKKQQNQISPVLYLNVTMEGYDNVKVPVYQTDTFQNISEKIRVFMNIQNGQQQKKKLQIILKNQIIPALDSCNGLGNLHNSFLSRQQIINFIS